MTTGRLTKGWLQIFSEKNMPRHVIVARFMLVNYVH